MKKNNVIVSLILVLILSLSLGIFTACSGGDNQNNSGSETSITSTGGNNSTENNDSGNTSDTASNNDSGSTSDGVSNEHKHTFADTWSYDDTHHWYACTGADCKEVKDKAEHTWDEGVVTKEPTVDTKGEKTFTCTVCKKAKVEELPVVEPAKPEVKTEGYYLYNSCNIPALETELKATYAQLKADKTFTFGPYSGGIVHGTYTVNEATVTLTVDKMVMPDGQEYIDNPKTVITATLGQNGEIVADVTVLLGTSAPAGVTATATYAYAKELPPTPSDSVDVVLDADDLGSYEVEKVLGYNVKMVGGASKAIVVDANKKTLDGINFTHRIKLGGTIQSDARYIEITVEKASIIKVYAMSGSSSKERALNLYTDLTKLKEEPLASFTLNGTELQVVEYKVSAGTYYLGSGDSGINIYGIYIRPDDGVAPANILKTDGYYVIERCYAVGNVDQLGDDSQAIFEAYAGTYHKFNADGTCVIVIPSEHSSLYGTYTQGENGIITITPTKLVQNGEEIIPTPEQAEQSKETLELKDGKLIMLVYEDSNGSATVTYYFDFKFTNELPQQAPSIREDAGYYVFASCQVTGLDGAAATLENELKGTYAQFASDGTFTFEPYSGGVVHGTYVLSGNTLTLTVDKMVMPDGQEYIDNPKTVINATVNEDGNLVADVTMLLGTVPAGVTATATYKFSYTLGSDPEPQPVSLPLDTQLVYSSYEFTPEAAEETKTSFLQSGVQTYAGSYIVFKADGTFTITITAQGAVEHGTYTIKGDSIILTLTKIVFSNGTEAQIPAEQATITVTYINGVLRIPADSGETVYVLYQVPAVAA